MSIERGDGKEYFRKSFQILTNQEVEWSGSEASFASAILWRMLSGNKVIIPNKESCLRWILAVAPREHTPLYLQSFDKVVGSAANHILSDQPQGVLKLKYTIIL